MLYVTVVSFVSPNSTERLPAPAGVPSVARMRTIAGLGLEELEPPPGGPGGGSALDQRRSAAKRRSTLDGKNILLTEGVSSCSSRS